ncbi:MAG TPA: hypothetical protein VF857_07745 [Spirochaetota bacterium]
MKKIIQYIFAFAILITGCAAPTPKGIESPLLFAVIGNTYPESPFKQPSPDIEKLINVLNRENPTFVIHEGNVIYAGFTPGLRAVDATRQFSESADSFSNLKCSHHFVPGDFDTFGGLPDAFESFTGRKSYHTFIYGPVLCIILNTTDPRPGIISDTQIAWLEDTLRDSHSESIIVFSHHPFFPQKGYDGALVAGSDRIAEILSKYAVRGVISGAGENFFRTERNGIEYINLGCVPLHKKEYGEQSRYYLISFFEDHLTITGKKL